MSRQELEEQLKDIINEVATVPPKELPGLILCLADFVVEELGVELDDEDVYDEDI